MTVTVRDVAKRLGGTAALDGVSLEIAAGETVALVGPSGAGKTTLLRLVAGLETPDRGAVLFDGKDAAALPPRDRGVGWVPQHGGLYPQLDVAGNLAFGLQSRRWPTAEIAARVRELLEAVRLEGCERRFPDELSGGERQRVAFARALAARPRVLLLDEPFGALDPPVRRELRDQLRGWTAGAATLLVTHDREEAFAVGDRIALLRAGRLVQAGTPADFRTRPAEPWVAWFLGHSA